MAIVFIKAADIFLFAVFKKSCNGLLSKTFPFRRAIEASDLRREEISGETPPEEEAAGRKTTSLVRQDNLLQGPLLLRSFIIVSSIQIRLPQWRLYIFTVFRNSCMVGRRQGVQCWICAGSANGNLYQTWEERSLMGLLARHNVHKGLFVCLFVCLFAVFCLFGCLVVWLFGCFLWAEVTRTSIQRSSFACHSRMVRSGCLCLKPTGW